MYSQSLEKTIRGIRARFRRSCRESGEDEDLLVRYMYLSSSIELPVGDGGRYMDVGSDIVCSGCSGVKLYTITCQFHLPIGSLRRRAALVWGARAHVVVSANPCPRPTTANALSPPWCKKERKITCKWERRQPPFKHQLS